MAINPNEINIKNIIELIQSSSIKDNDLLVIGQGIYARKSTILELYNKFGVPSILTSLNSLQFQINQLNNTVGNSVLYSPQVKTAQQKADARNNLNVYSRSETQTVVNSAIVNLGNVVNSVNGVNVDNTDPKNPIVAEFRPIADYNNDMLNKADIDGNLTTGGIWWQDQVLSDRFANYKQVWTALTNNTIEWGNIELDKHIFLVDDINGLKIKVGGSEGTIWNTLNLTNVSQLNNDAGYITSGALGNYVNKAGDTMSDSLKMLATNGLQSNIVRDLSAQPTGGVSRPLFSVKGANEEIGLWAELNNGTFRAFVLADENYSGLGIEFNRDGTVRINDATAPKHAVNLGQLLAYNYTTLPLVQTWVNQQGFSNTATESNLGIMKLGSDVIQLEPKQAATSIANRTFPVQLNDDEQAVVNIPYKDYDTAISDLQQQITDLSNLIIGLQSQLDDKINKTDTITICGVTKEYSGNPNFDHICGG